MSWKGIISINYFQSKICIFIRVCNMYIFCSLHLIFISHCPLVLNLLVLYSREDKHPLTVKFTNRTGKRIQLFWINNKGRRKRKGKLKDGHSKMVDTYETHVFMAFNKKLSREPLLINGSPVFYAFPQKHGSSHLEVEIKKPSGTIQTVRCFDFVSVHI